MVCWPSLEPPHSLGQPAGLKLFTGRSPFRFSRFERVTTEFGCGTHSFFSRVEFAPSFQISISSRHVRPHDFYLIM